MKLKPLVAAVSAALGVTLVSSVTLAAPRLQSVEFFGMEAPDSTEEKANIYTEAQVKYTYVNHKNQAVEHLYDLKYHQLMGTTDSVNGRVVGGLYDVDRKPLYEKALSGALDYQMASDAADGTSLLDISGMRAGNPAKARPLAMVINFEYKEIPPKLDGVKLESHWSKLPAVVGLAKLDQDKKTGALQVMDYRPVDFSKVRGGWIHCGSTPSSWGTHVSSEEYEPDAKTREGLPPATKTATTEATDDATDIASFSKYYFGDETIANPYHYGLVPEVMVDKDGKGTVVKHYAPGRYAREMIEFASDDRTHIGGDDGKNTALFMFVADKPKDLSAGTLYAAKVKQRTAANGGSFDLEWIKLGHANNAEIQALVDDGIKFSDIFDVSLTDPDEDDQPGEPADDDGYTKVTTYMGTEWLRLKPGMGTAAAFLESRRYAALMGATTEFSKMEYIAFNETDRKFYLTISRVEAGMADTKGDIQLARNDGGIILEMSTKKDNAIGSDFVGTTLTSIPELVGGWRTDGSKDSEGNACVQEKPCGPDNLRYVDAIRTLFLGEDTSRRNNNYVWAFNIDTRKLSRILSVPMNAEATGLTVVPNQNGFAYITSNFQHPGEDRGTPYGNDPLANYKGTDKEEVLHALDRNWNKRTKAAIGYIGIEGGALPAMKDDRRHVEDDHGPRHREGHGR
jgi:hypothetical protein